MSEDTRIVRSLREAAEHAAVPPLDVERLRAGGRRYARRRTAAAVGAAALVLAVVGAGVALGADLGGPEPGPVKRDDRPAPVDPPRSPKTVADLPQGDPPSLPYLVGTVLHAGSTSTDIAGPGELMGLRYGAHTTLGLDSERGAVRITETGDLRVLDPGASGFPAVSPDGRLAAWPGGTTTAGTEVVVWSVEQDEESRRFVVPEQPTCCDSGFRVAGIADDGTVYVSGDRAHYVVDAAAGDVRVVEGLDPSSDSIVMSRDGLVVLSAPTSEEGDGRARLGRIVDGRLRTDIEHVGPDVAGSSWWSPYARGQIVYRGLGGGLRAFEVDGDMYAVPERVAVPSDADVNEVAWESADAMLVQVAEGDHGWWLRCSVESGGCERAADLGAGAGNVVTLARR